MEVSNSFLENAEQSVNKLKKWTGILAPKFPEIQQLYENASSCVEQLKNTIENNPNAISYAINIALIAAPIAIFCKSYCLSLEIDEHIGKIRKLVDDFLVLYKGDIKPLLNEVNQKLDPAYGKMLVGEVKEWMSKLESITKSLDEILEGAYSELLNNMQCQTTSYYLGFLGLGTAVVAGGAAFAFPPLGVGTFIAYAGSGLLGLGTASFSLSNSNRLKETKVKGDKLVRKINECRKEIKTVIMRLDIRLMDLEAEQ